MEVTFLTNRDEERIVADKLLFTEQSLTGEQQSQVRTNIGAIGAGELPSTLPNPHRLVFTGAVSAEYDGSEAVQVNIPEGDSNGGGIPVPEIAEVGQTIVVKAVDENGKPTEWEAADLPSGDWAEWKLVANVTLEEDVDSVAINTDMDGNAISASKFSELFIRYKLLGHGSGNYSSRYSNLNIWFNDSWGGGSNAEFTNGGNGYDGISSSIHAVYPKDTTGADVGKTGIAIHAGNGTIARFSIHTALASVNLRPVAGLKAGSQIIVYGR